MPDATEKSNPGAEEIAERAAQAMLDADPVAQSLGMVLDCAGAGFARTHLTVREEMLNGLGTCHGGTIFTLADTTFALACNSYNAVAVAQTCEIVYLAPGRLGDCLTADCREQATAGRSAVYDVRVTNQDGVAIALFRGKSRRIQGKIVPDLPTTFDSDSQSD